MDLGFDPTHFDPAQGGVVDPVLRTITVRAAGKEPAYVYSQRIVLAVNLALATSRPLFVAGRPGTGKTTLARNVAHVLEAKYYQAVVTSRTRAKDLMWTFDSLRRLSDAQEREKDLPPRAAYIQPQVLWWAFDPTDARTRGATAAETVDVADDLVMANPAGRGAVVLLDEIDKAEPDVPNDLLEALDVARFTVDELDRPRPVVAPSGSRLLLIITSNAERELPPAFLRRCVVLNLDDPTADWLVTVANDRFGVADAAFHRVIADRVMALRTLAREQDLREPSTAEYLNTIEACRKLGIDETSPTWRLVAEALLWKRETPQMPDVPSAAPVNV
jgi:MoxR-like ATPase